MPTIDHNALTLRIDGLGTDSAGHWAARAVTIGAVQASISDDGGGALRLTVDFAPSAGNRGPMNLATMLLFASEIEGVDADKVLENAKRRSS